MDKVEPRNYLPKRKIVNQHFAPETLYNSTESDDLDASNRKSTDTKQIDLKPNDEESTARYSETSLRKVNVEDFKFLKVLALLTKPILKILIHNRFWAKVPSAKLF